RHLHRRFACYRVERTSSRVGVASTEVQRLSRRTITSVIAENKYPAVTDSFVSAVGSASVPAGDRAAPGGPNNNWNPFVPSAISSAWHSFRGRHAFCANDVKVNARSIQLLVKQRAKCCPRKLVAKTRVPCRQTSQLRLYT